MLRGFLLIVVSTACPALASAAPEVPQDLLTSLKAAAESLGAVHITWEAASFNSKRTRVSRRYEYAKNGDWVYAMESYDWEGKSTTHRSSFDGERVYRDGNLKAEDSRTLTVDLAESMRGSRPDFPLHYGEYLRHSGFVVPAEIGALTPKWQVISLLDDLMHNRFGVVTSVKKLENEADPLLEVIVDDRENVHVLRFDSSIGWAMRYYEMQSPKGEVFTVTNSDFANVVEQKLWLPKRSELVRFADASKAAETARATTVVSQIDTTPRDRSFFQLTERPEYRKAGTWITDSTLGSDEVTYRMPADESQISQSIDEARRQLANRGTPAGRLPTIYVVMAINAVGLVALVVVWVWRRKRLRQ